jgi:hypothetical protein
MRWLAIALGALWIVLALTLHLFEPDPSEPFGNGPPSRWAKAYRP